MNAKRNPILSDRLPGVWKFLEDSCLTSSSSRNITNTNLYATIRQSTNNIEYSSSRPSPNLSILCYTFPISPTQPSSIPRQWPLLPTDGHPILSSLHAPASSSAQPSPPTPKPSRLSAATPADNSFTRVEPRSLSSRLSKKRINEWSATSAGGESAFKVIVLHNEPWPPSSPTATAAAAAACYR